MSTFRPVYVGLGSNMGTLRANLEAAVVALGDSPGLHDVQVSRFIVTEPVGPVVQPDFLNAALAARSDWCPEAILNLLFRVEHSLGRRRKRRERWGPRVIDLDLLMVGELVVDSPLLTLPHPEMTSRRFVLEPLAEIAPRAVHPVTGKTVAQLLEELN